MNFLAHIYLSGDDDYLKIGNFIADSVRGKNFTKYPKRVAQGIMLHRYIDTFTDTHPVVKESKDLIRSEHGLWSSVIVDIFYDHFLAAHWNNYHKQPLAAYVQDFYSLLQKENAILPNRVQTFLPIMVRNDWLTSYATLKGISTILYQMNKRTKNLSNMNYAILDLENHYKTLESHFIQFMKELEDYVAGLDLDKL